MGPEPHDASRALRDTLALVDALQGTPLTRIPGGTIMVLDRDLRVHSFGGAGCADLGIDAEAWVGRLLSDCISEPAMTALGAELAKVLEGETLGFSLDASGDRAIWVSALPIRHGDGAQVEGVMAVSWDQTGARRAEDRYRLLAENATDVVTRHDPGGTYLYVSPSIEGFLGYAPDDLLGRSSLELIHPEDVDGVITAMADASMERRVVTLTYRIRRSDGTYAWAESRCRWIGGVEIQCSTWDVSERRRAERELAHRLAQQSAVARLGDLALQRVDLGALHEEAARLVAETLDVDLVYALEHLGDARMRVRGAFGFREGFAESEFEVLSFGGERLGGAYVDGAVVVDDLRSHPMRAAPLRAHGAVSCSHVLVGDRDAPIGLLGAHTTTPRRFSAQDLDFLHAVAHVLAGALERVRVEERIRHDALHDALTGLPNRTLLLDRLRLALARARRDGTRVAVLFLDLDHLKVVNDSLGHDAGDDLLRAVGPRLSAVLRPSDTVARFGGDEFAVVLEGVEDERDAIGVAQRIVAAFEAPFTVAGEPRFGSASVGLVVTHPGAPHDAEELLSDADAAMYLAKERGRGRLELFDAGLRARITARLTLESDLRRAIEEGDDLWIAYQPFWRIPSRELAGVEALLRWDHRERGSVPPSEFIPVAEESGLIVDLGARVLRTACAQVVQWRRTVPALQLTVNVSARQVAAPGLVATVAKVLSETGLEPSALGLEITEGLLLEETPATGQVIRGLQDLGVRLILDDFGTGYSSLRYLQRYPLDGLKVDRTFVAGLGPDGRGDGAIVQAIVGMARALGMRVIPEGVETEEQLARLADLGCDYAQGFLLSRPMRRDGIEPLLAAPAPA